MIDTAMTLLAWALVGAMPARAYVHVWGADVATARKIVAGRA